MRVVAGRGLCGVWSEYRAAPGTTTSTSTLQSGCRGENAKTDYKSRVRGGEKVSQIVLYPSGLHRVQQQRIVLVAYITPFIEYSDILNTFYISKE